MFVDLLSILMAVSVAVAAFVAAILTWAATLLGSRMDDYQFDGNSMGGYSDYGSRRQRRRQHRSENRPPALSAGPMMFAMSLIALGFVAIFIGSG